MRKLSWLCGIVGWAMIATGFGLTAAGWPGAIAIGGLGLVVAAIVLSEAK